jgi:hypothetical protein
MKKLGKKADVDTKMLMEAGLMVLGGVVVVVLLALFASMVGTWNTNKDVERTNNNFANLVSGIEDELLVGAYPIFIDKKHIVVGFGERPVVSLDCTNPQVHTFEPGAAELLRKPASCQQQSCICLCEHDGPNPQEDENGWYYELGDYACNPAYGSVDCRIIEDITFEGATFVSGGSCDFAFIGGKNENQNIYIAKHNDAVSICAEDCTLGSTQQEPSQEEPAEPVVAEVVQSSSSGEKVLLIGASHTKGYYGQKLYALFNEAGYNTELYARGGSGPLHWIEGSNANWFVNEEVGTHIDEQGQHSELPGAIPEQYFSALKDTYEPSIIVISLGTNIIAYSGTAKIREDTQRLSQKASQNAQCFWVGPPITTREDLAPKLSAAIQEIQMAAESYGCSFINAEPYSSPSGLTSDEIHFRKTVGEEIAVGVFNEMQGTLMVT